MTDAIDELRVKPIGVIRSPLRELAEAPRQARLSPVRASIELLPGHNFEDALSDLEGWEYIWVLAWMHRATGWRPKVQPPRSELKRGVFSTRAPHRPNPIALSSMRLIAVRGLTLEVEECDFIDGTPVLDIKPYVPYSDAIPEAKTGWLAPPDGALPGGERPADPRPLWTVDYEPRAQEQLDWLAQRGIELEARITQALELGPQPHAYRRIAEDDRGWRIAVKDWYARFETRSDQIVVTAIESGVRPRNLPEAAPIHREFIQQFARPA